MTSVTKGAVSLKNEKDFKSDLNEENLESSLSKSDNYNQEQLNDELEKLADTFRTELKKAKEREELIEKTNSEKGAFIKGDFVPEEELCECCGERLKEENDSYCNECKELMRRYPIGASSVIIAVCIILVSVVSVMAFINDFSGYNKSKIAKNYDSENKRYTAIQSYDEAINFFLEKDVTPKKLLKDSALNVMYSLPNGVSSFYDVSERIEDSLTKFEAKLPIYSEYEKIRDESLIIYETFNQFTVIMANSDYADFDGEDKEMFQTIYNDIGSLSGKEFTIKSLKTGENKNVVYDEAAIFFSQFLFAYSYEEYELAYDCIKKVHELSPQHTGMYAYELATIETQYGNYEFSNELADILKSLNSEDSTPYIIYAYNYRMNGELNKALKATETGLKIDSTDPDLLRHKAIVLALNGKYDESLELLEQLLEFEKYGIVYLTELAVATEMGNTEKQEEIEKIIEEANGTVPDRIQSYLDGKITFKQLFTEGSGDVQ